MRRHHVISFKYAFEGLKTAFVTQPNLRIHLLFIIAAIIAGFFFQISPVEWAILALTIAVVIVAELINTSIEATIDLVTSERHPLAKIAKDVAAAAVLFASIISIIVGLVVFVPKLMGRL